MSDAPEFPTASIVHKTASPMKLSKWWWLTLACVLLAIGLAWMSHRPAGIPIRIQFDQGHGLKVGDTIRHRGIEVGTVEAVELSQDLRGIEVAANLSQKAKSLAVADSRFWIVRPRIEMDGVSGLDTAIGPKYIRVAPGRSITQKRDFTGLTSQPMDADFDLGGVAENRSSKGLELLLRSRRRKGIYASAPVSYRGVQVGKVLSVGLSPDAEFVDVRARIDEGYRKLVRTSSVFWITSGFEVDIGMSGVNVDAESLASIAKGGVTFVTRSADADESDLVEPGHAFTLNEKLDEQWLDQASPIRLVTMPNIPVMNLKTSWQESFLGIDRTQEDGCVAITIKQDGNSTLLVPNDILARQSDPNSRGFAAQIVTPKDSQGVPLDVEAATNTNSTEDQGGLPSVVQIPLPTQLSGAASTEASRLRPLIVNQPEDCFVSFSGSVETSMPMIARQSIAIRDGYWTVKDARFSRRPWHGAPVMSASDRRLIGMLMVTDAQVVIVPIPSDL